MLIRLCCVITLIALPAFAQTQSTTTLQVPTTANAPTMSQMAPKAGARKDTSYANNLKPRVQNDPTIPSYAPKAGARGDTSHVGKAKVSPSATMSQSSMATNTTMSDSGSKKAMKSRKSADGSKTHVHGTKMHRTDVQRSNAQERAITAQLNDREHARVQSN